MSSSNYQTDPGAFPDRPTVAAGTLWAGGLATAVMAALAYAVGVVIVRVLFDIPVLAPEREGALGDLTTWQLAGTAFIVALLATAVMHLLFAQVAETSSQIATAIINLVVGAMITSLVRGVAGRAIRPARRASPYGDQSGTRPASPGYPPSDGYPGTQPRPGDPYGPR